MFKEGGLLIVGNNLKLSTYEGGHYNEGKIYVYGFRMLEENTYSLFTKKNSLCSFSGCPEGDYGGIGLKDSWNDPRNDLIKSRRDEKCFYDVVDYNLCSRYYGDDANIKVSKFIEKSWNEAWSELQWKPK